MREDLIKLYEEQRNVLDSPAIFANAMSVSNQYIKKQINGEPLGNKRDYICFTSAYFDRNKFDRNDTGLHSSCFFPKDQFAQPSCNILSEDAFVFFSARAKGAYLEMLVTEVENSDVVGVNFALAGKDSGFVDAFATLISAQNIAYNPLVYE